MTSFRLRWIVGWGLVGLAAALYWIINEALVNSFRPAALVSGATLLAFILVLACFNARKKLPFLPLATASAWLQFHIYAGLFAVALFFIHCGFRLPRGFLETTLAVLFFAVTLSGIVGFGISRWVPARLTLRGGNVIFEKIPALRHGVKQEAEALAVASVSRTQSTTIADFYEQRLRDYFERPRHLWQHLIGYSKPLHRLLAEVEALHRYLNAEERTLIEQISRLIRTKENLDFQLASQGLLKLWLFVHIPLTFALILCGVLHGVAGWTFR
jgi:hypothetical protein